MQQPEETGGHFAKLRAHAEAAEARVDTLRRRVAEMLTQSAGYDPNAGVGKLVVERFHETSHKVDDADIETAFGDFLGGYGLTATTAPEDDQ